MVQLSQCHWLARTFLWTERSKNLTEKKLCMSSLNLIIWYILDFLSEIIRLDSAGIIFHHLPHNFPVLNLRLFEFTIKREWDGPPTDKYAIVSFYLSCMWHCRELRHVEMHLWMRCIVQLDNWKWETIKNGAPAITHHRVRCAATDSDGICLDWGRTWDFSKTAVFFLSTLLNVFFFQ